MGFTRDYLSKVIALALIQTSGGTYTLTRAGGPIWSINKTAAADTTYVRIPVLPPVQSGKLLNGARLTSIDIWWTNATGDLTSLTPTVNLALLPANAAAPAAPTALTFTYDTGHDLAAERITQAAHKMTLTVTTPAYLDDDQELFVELAIVAAAGSVVKVYDARVNYELNI